MNLNRYKKGFTKTNPERGLYQLPGARKREPADNGSSTIRVKGHYIPAAGIDRIGESFGLAGYIHAWIYVILLPCSIVSDGPSIFSPLSVFILGFAVIHGCAMFADGLRHSEAPWARRGIKVFWISTLAFCLIGIIASVLGS